jgi:hypothetical protein
VGVCDNMEETGNRLIGLLEGWSEAISLGEFKPQGVANTVRCGQYLSLDLDEGACSDSSQLRDCEGQTRGNV